MTAINTLYAKPEVYPKKFQNFSDDEYTVDYDIQSLGLTTETIKTSKLIWVNNEIQNLCPTFTVSINIETQESFMTYLIKPEDILIKEETKTEINVEPEVELIDLDIVDQMVINFKTSTLTYGEFSAPLGYDIIKKHIPYIGYSSIRYLTNVLESLREFDGLAIKKYKFANDMLMLDIYCNLFRKVCIDLINYVNNFKKSTTD